VVLLSNYMTYQQYRPQFESEPGWSNLQGLPGVDALITVALTIYAVGAGLALWLRRENAVRTGQDFLIATIFVNVVVNPMLILITFARLSPDASFAATMLGWLRCLIGAAVGAAWLAYLKRSRRVRETYASSVATVAQ